jgi:hypothetical protein
MIKATMPIATGPDEIWVRFDLDRGRGRGPDGPLPRLASVHRAAQHVFNPGAVLPTYTATGQLVPGLR